MRQLNNDTNGILYKWKEEILHNSLFVIIILPSLSTLRDRLLCSDQWIFCV